MLAGSERDIVVCVDRESLVCALAERRPDVLVYVFGELDKDLSFLITLRRIAATLPIILLDGPTDLAARRSIQELRPTYYGVSPFEDFEVSEVVRGALSRMGLR